MQTTVHVYNYDLTKPHEKQAYQTLCNAMEAQGVRCFESWGNGSHYLPRLDGVTVELETKFLFNNQWNTAPIPGVSEKGYRLFDWAQDHLPNKKIKRGHYLDLTDDMVAVRHNQLKCGYCGARYVRAEAPTFCQKCLGSEYLKQEDLRLLRLRSIADDRAHQFSALTDEESAFLTPLYLAAQLQGNLARTDAEHTKQRQTVERLLEEAQQEAKDIIKHAERAYAGKKWLLDRGIYLTSNTIYYKHTQTFCIGWLTPIDPMVKTELEKKTQGFPYPLVIQTEKKY